MFGRLQLFCLMLLGALVWVPLVDAAPDAPTGKSAVQPGGRGEQVCAYTQFLRAKSAELAGRNGEAIEAYERAIACDPKAEHLLRSLSVLLIRIGQREQAIAWINRLIALNPADTSSRTLLANLYTLMDRHDEAVLLYQAILVDEPKNFNVMLLLGGLHARARDYDKARQILERLVADNPDSYAGFYYLAKLYQEMRLPEQAVSAYEQALKLNWSAALAYELADLHERDERFEQAIALYRRLLAEERGDERARARLAKIYLLQGDMPKAMQELEELRAVSGDPDRIELSICRLFLDQKKYPEAVTCLDGLLTKNPGNDAARALLIITHYQQGDLAATKQVLRQVKPGAQAYEESILMLVRLLEDEKDLAGAEKVLLDAMANAEYRRLNFYVNMALLLHGQGKIAEAHGVFKRALTDFSEKSAVHHEYGLFLHRINDPSGAISQMEEVVRLDPNHPQALNYLGFTWADEGRNLEQAREYVERAVAKLPREGYIRDSLGWVYYRQGDFPAAVRELETAVDLSPDDPAIFEHLGDARLKNQDTKGARAAYDRALALYNEEGQKALIRKKIEALPPQNGQGQ